MSKKSRRIVFYGMLIIAFLAVTIYEFLTPNMSDDLIYWDTVHTADNVFDLFKQEAGHWLSHTGRSVSHIILRIFLFINVKAVFNIVAGAVFVILTLLIYANVQGKKEYDVKVYGFILIMLWFLDPAIANTVFWEDGACNYMFTMTIIMGFITLYRKNLDVASVSMFSENITGQNKEKTWIFAFGMFLYGIIAGWCNENTSGGLILFMLIELGYRYIKNQKNFSFIKPWMITGLVGSIIGFIMMILSPGNYGRLNVTEEEHTGLVAMLARFLKITLNIKNHYIILVAAFMAILVFIFYFCERNELFVRSVRFMTLFTVLFVATCYALIMIPSSELRSYYGAGIFLMTAIAQGIATLGKCKEKLIKATITAIAIIAGVIFSLSYFEDGANLARIKREFDERDAYLTEMAANGADDVQAPMLRPLWQTRFSVAYEADIHEDWQYWINFFMAQHYGLGTIHGVERENWDVY